MYHGINIHQGHAGCHAHLSTSTRVYATRVRYVGSLPLVLFHLSLPPPSLLSSLLPRFPGGPDRSLLGPPSLCCAAPARPSPHTSRPTSLAWRDRARPQAGKASRVHHRHPPPLHPLTTVTPSPLSLPHHCHPSPLSLPHHCHPSPLSSLHQCHPLTDVTTHPLTTHPLTNTTHPLTTVTPHPLP